MNEKAGLVFDVEPTKIMEFSTLFQNDRKSKRDFDKERQMLREARDLYECGRLRHRVEQGGVVSADVMDAKERRIIAHVVVHSDGELIYGMSCSCTPKGAPSCVHACAVCFWMFYKHRYQPQKGRTTIPLEASQCVDQYLHDRLGTGMPTSDEADGMAAGLERIIGFDRWEDWLSNRHTAYLFDNCLPSIEECVDMDTDIWPKLDEPDLDMVLPHGWFTLLEAAYEQLGNVGQLAKIYCVYIVQGVLPQDARYVDRLQWLLSDTMVSLPVFDSDNKKSFADDLSTLESEESGSDYLQNLIGIVTSKYRPTVNDQNVPITNRVYEHLLREFQLSDEALAYCETTIKADPYCRDRLSETIAIKHDNQEVNKRLCDNWRHAYGQADIDDAIRLFRWVTTEYVPMYYVNEYVDPIIDDCIDLIRSAGNAGRVRFQSVVKRRFATATRATIARDLLMKTRDSALEPSNRYDILHRAFSEIAQNAHPLSRMFVIDDDVEVFTVPLDELTLQREQPDDFMEALNLADHIGDTPLTHDPDEDLAIVEQYLHNNLEQRKITAHFDDIVSAQDDEYDPEKDEKLSKLSDCLSVQLHALFGSRYALDSKQYNDLFDPAVTVGQRNKWMRPTAGELGLWAAMLVLRTAGCKDYRQAAHLPHYLASKGLKTAIMTMLDHMLSVTAMLNIPRSQVDVDEWQALHMLRVDQHPDAVDAHGNSAIMRPDRDGVLSYMTQVLQATTVPDLEPICAEDTAMIHELIEQLQEDSDDTTVADEIAILLCVIEEPQTVLPLIDASLAQVLGDRAKSLYTLFWNTRDENDENPGDDPDGQERGISEYANVMLIMLEEAYTRLMQIAQPGYKDW